MDPVTVCITAGLCKDPPEIITSVALRMPSSTECWQPYMLSNLDFVTASLVLKAVNSSLPFACSRSRWQEWHQLLHLLVALATLTSANTSALPSRLV